ncbi:unnamed protein product, partial [Symbiodinium sp. CCMP2592]
EDGVLPSLLCVLRCTAHASQKALERAMLTNVEVKELLDTLVFNFASGKHDRGSLARALTNSPKMHGMLKEELSKDLNQLYELSSQSHSSAGSFHFAAQRWDSTLKCLRIFALRMSEILSLLARVAADKTDQNQNWAKSMLNFLSMDRIILLCLCVEFMEVASRYVHACDNPGGSIKASSASKAASSLPRRIAQLACTASNLRLRLDQLFSFTFQGVKQVPLVMDERFEKGYVQIVTKALSLGQKSFSVIAGGKLLYHLQGYGAERLRKVTAEKLGILWNIQTLFLQGVWTENEIGIASGFSPFDVGSWLKENKDDASLPALLEPVAKVVGVQACAEGFGYVVLAFQLIFDAEADALAKELQLARPTVQALLT